MPDAFAHLRRPSLWIADSDPSVACAVQFLASHCGLVDVHIFESKLKAIKCLQTRFAKPTLLITDYFGGQMRGSEFIRLARQASPETKLILFSAAVDSAKRWITVAGLNIPKPDAIVEKPDIRALMAALGQPDNVGSRI
jgi:CheY-like chemotaxis protein